MPHTEDHRSSSHQRLVWCGTKVRDVRFEYFETMGQYEEIILLETAAGPEFRTSKVSLKEIKTGLRLKLPKEYSTYAVSK